MFTKITKDFLSFIIYGFALLGSITTFEYSYAMQEEGVEKEPHPYAQRKLPEGLVRILAPFENTNLHPLFLKITHQNYGPQSLILAIPAEVTCNIFSFLGTSNLLEIQKVCKFWRVLCIEETRRQQSLQLQLGAETEELLKTFISSPQNLYSAHKILGAITPISSEILKFHNQPWCYIPYCEEPKNSMAEKFILMLKDSCRLHSDACRMYLNHFDIWDICTNSFIASIVKQIPQIQKMLEEVVECLNFDPIQFSNLAEDFENHPRLQQYLKALKLLALSSHKKAQDYLKKLSQPVEQFLQPVYDKDLGKYLRPELTGHPLWGIYIPTSCSLNLQWDSILYLNMLDPLILKSLWEYTSITIPDNAVFIFSKYYMPILKKYNMDKHKEDIRSILSSINAKILGYFVNRENYGSLDEEEDEWLKFLSTPIEGCMMDGYYSFSLLILEEIHRRFRSGALRPEMEEFSRNHLHEEIKLKMAECILATHEKTRFSEAERYVNESIEKIDSNESKKGDRQELPMEGANFEEQLNEFTDLNAYQMFCMANCHEHAFSLQIILQIYQGKFKEAAKKLLLGHVRDQFILFIALKDQIFSTDLPNDFIALLGKRYWPEVFIPKFFIINKFQDPELSDWEKNFLKGLLNKSLAEYGWFFDVAIQKGVLERSAFEGISAVLS